MDQMKASLATPFEKLSHYAGFDWAKDRHQLAVVNRAGQVLLELVDRQRSFFGSPR